MKRPDTHAVVPKYPMLAQIGICQGCCCGNTSKAHPPVPVEWLKREWKHRGLLKQVHLTITGCLGPCDVPNVVQITAGNETRWLCHLSTQDHYAELAAWAEKSRDAGRLLPLPAIFSSHRLSAMRGDSAFPPDVPDGRVR
jgi:hypothetical protein